MNFAVIPLNAMQHLPDWMSGIMGNGVIVLSGRSPKFFKDKHFVIQALSYQKIIKEINLRLIEDVDMK